MAGCAGKRPVFLLIPVLGDHYGNILERRELRLKFDADSREFSVYYYHHRFPIDPRTYPFNLNALHAQLLKIFDPLLLEYQTLDGSFRKLPDRTTATMAHREDRNRDYSVNAFHFFNQERNKKWLHAMLNLSTHDSKHGADVRPGLML